MVGIDFSWRSNLIFLGISVFGQKSTQTTRMNVEEAKEVVAKNLAQVNQISVDWQAKYSKEIKEILVLLNKEFAKQLSHFVVLDDEERTDLTISFSRPASPFKKKHAILQQIYMNVWYSFIAEILENSWNFPQIEFAFAPSSNSLEMTVKTPSISVDPSSFISYTTK